MKRHPLLVVLAVLAMIAAAALAPQKNEGKLLVLDWAAKAKEEKPPLAILLEFGLKDAQPKDWSGRATVAGAKVVHREGYRFRSDDKLVDPDAWVAKSHRPLRAPPKQPAVITLEPIASVGVVLHLADVKDDATLALSVKEQEIDNVKVSLKDLVAGKAQALAGGVARARLISTATPVMTAKTEDDFPAACYGPDGTLWVAYISYTVKEESRRIEAPQLKVQPKDFKSYFTPEFGDQLFVKYLKDGKWSEPIAVTGPGEDLMRCAIAAEGDGTVWVVYSANRKGSYDLYARKIAPNTDAEVRLTENKDARFSTSVITPSAATDKSGTVFVAVQEWKSVLQGNPPLPPPFLGVIGTCACKKGVWTGLSRSYASHISSGESTNSWHPCLAAGPNNEMVSADDTYDDGSYHIDLGPARDKDNGKQVDKDDGNSKQRYYLGASARPSICYDPAGRVWIAYEQLPEKWGKDFGALDDKDGNPLYFARTVKVVCLVDGKLMRPVAELPPLAKRGESPDTGQKVEALPRYAYPKIGIDGKGRVWLTYRQKFGSRYTTHPGSYWLDFARRLDGDKWTEPIEVHHSDGLLDSRPVLLPHPAGGLRIIHNTDGRYTTPEAVDNQIYMSYVDLPGETINPKLVEHEPGKKDEKLVKEAEKEREAVKRIRDYRIEAGGKKLQLLRGEFHRHTEISWDGGPDGSLEDMFRYAIDAAAFDWIGNGDHDNGAGREYSWWLTQKFTDAYTVKDRFTGMFTYERSVPYPHGHRNCMFAKRGVRTLPRLAEPDMEKRVAGVHADDTKMLYRYLREMDGICAVHTSATSMGTDWRDNDPAVEPIVEIYQGDRMSYEKEEAPRAGYDPKTGKKPTNIAGWFPKGFVNLALKEKGYKMGFQASSDHFSTHISYMIVLAEKNDREAILAAVKKRHIYGATDNIICDVRSGTHIMGDEFKSSGAPQLDITVAGTGPIARIDIIRDSEVIDTLKPEKADYKGKWTDPKPLEGVHYYYIRVLQTDDEIAWTSPMWIDCVK